MNQLSLPLVLLLLSTVACAEKPTKKSVPTTEVGGGSNAVVATYKGQPITDAEIRNQPEMKMELYEAALKVYKAEEAEYNTFKEAVESQMQERVVKEEAAARKLSEEELIKQDVESKIKPVSDKEIKAFYDEKKINRPLDTIKDRIKEYLTNQRVEEKKKEYFAKLMKKYNVQVSLGDYDKPKPLPPKVEVATESSNAVRGPSGAKVTIVEFSDYQCPFCGRAEETVQEVMKKYKRDVKLVFRHFPLEFHKDAPGAALAAECAKDQKKFWEMHDILFKNQKALKPEDLKGYAKQANLDQKKFDECLDSKKDEAMVNSDMEAGKKLGVRGTPAFFINGRMLSGAQPLEAFAELIDMELGK